VTTSSDHHARAIDASRRKHPGKELRDLSVAREFPEFHSGSLYVVGWTGPDSKRYEDNVLIVGDREFVFVNDEELVNFIGTTSKRESLAAKLLQMSGVSGVIAVIITLTICYLATQGKDPPGVLSNALTAILGFYFASTVYEARGRSA
jgi:hypothetical protein